MLGWFDSFGVFGFWFFGLDWWFCGECGVWGCYRTEFLVVLCEIGFSDLELGFWIFLGLVFLGLVLVARGFNLLLTVFGV